MFGFGKKVTQVNEALFSIDGDKVRVERCYPTHQAVMDKNRPDVTTDEWKIYARDEGGVFQRRGSEDTAEAAIAVAKKIRVK